MNSNDFFKITTFCVNVAYLICNKSKRFFFNRHTFSGKHALRIEALRSSAKATRAATGESLTPP